MKIEKKQKCNLHKIKFKKMHPYAGVFLIPPKKKVDKLKHKCF